MESGGGSATSTSFSGMVLLAIVEDDAVLKNDIAFVVRRGARCGGCGPKCACRSEPAQVVCLS